MIEVVVTTAARHRPTLIPSLRSLRVAGNGDSVTVLDDGSGLVTDPDIVHIVNDPPLGPLMNWCAALDHLLDRTDADWLAVLEDDIRWANGSWPILLDEIEIARHAFPDLGVYSLYIARSVSDRLEADHGSPLSPGLYRTWQPDPGRSQAYVFTRESAEWLRSNHRFARLRARGNRPFDPLLGAASTNRNRDLIVTSCLSRGGRANVFRVPGLVNHSLGSGNSSYYRKPLQDTVYWDVEARPVTTIYRGMRQFAWQT